MIWKVSSGRMLVSAVRIAALACAIGWPSMLPEQSRTKTISRGCGGRSFSMAGGKSISVK